MRLYAGIEKLAAGFALTLAVMSTARANDDIAWTINGFGTLGGTYTGDSSYFYVHNASEFKATNGQFDLGLDSRLGAQVAFSFGPDLSVIVEEEAKRRGSDNFSLGTEWAYLQYAPTANFKLRFGRVVLASFLMSDSRDVGYSQLWLRAPNEVYGSIPLENLDGVQALWRVDMGQLGLEVDGAYGTASQNLQGSMLAFTIRTKNLYNVSAALTYDNFLLRIAETSGSFPLTLPLGPTTAVSYSDHDKFLSAGFQYDDGKAIVLSEWTKRTENDVPLINLPLSISNEWYIAAGWRLGKVTPLLIYGKYDAGLTVFSGPQSLGTWSASLRYDIVRNLALKAQFSRPQVSNLTYFTTPNSSSSERVNVFSIAADFVF